MPSYDSFLLVSFGGPEGPDDVLPFLENVLRGRNVPRQRMEEVAEHYHKYGDVSPINQQNRDLISALQQAFQDREIRLPIYWGNRNWTPLLPDTIRKMRDDGCRRSLSFFTSMFSSYSGCRQYRENLLNACKKVGPVAPQIEKIRFGFNHPGFIQAMAQRVETALKTLGAEAADTPLLFTAHSIPLSMAGGCRYVDQLKEASRLVCQAIGAVNWELVYQSRSGPASQPWLEPDICDAIDRRIAQGSISKLVVVPIGFTSDHMEVIYDLDDEAAQHCQERGIKMARAGTVGTHPEFVRMICELVEERMSETQDRPALGELGPWHDVCPQGCCPAPARTRVSSGSSGSDSV